MKLQRMVPMVLGVVILLFGIYLVSTGGSVAGVYLPHLLGLPACNSGSNGNSTGFPSPGGCGFSPLGLGIGTIVVIFGLGLLASAFRGAMMSSSMGSGGMPALPPEMAATLELARSRMASMPAYMPPSIPAPMAPGVRPNTVYCSSCGQANLADAKFCHQCGTPMPVKPSSPQISPSP
ncbi:MAG: zinc ribbon domain-containing protein [Thermoplasmata archaeon]|nr:zinc ribbon domain-containing protein [Thermoplasmata archaeon]